MTMLPAFLTLPLFFKVSLGWILGAIASYINFYWLAIQVKNNLDKEPKKAKISAVKGTYFRMIFLLIYAFGIMSLIGPNIISFGLGLISIQIIIYLLSLWKRFS